jgi:hypothetical protein
MFPQVRSIFNASGEIWIKSKLADSHKTLTDRA